MTRSFATKLLALSLKGVSIATAVGMTAMIVTPVQAASSAQSAVANYVAAMKQAANNQNINQVANLVSDDALIVMTRRNKSTSLDKAAYLKLLQKSWQQTQKYHYDINVDNVVASGNQAKADIKTTESWVKNGQPVQFETLSRATLVTNDANQAMLLRAVTQVRIN